MGDLGGDVSPEIVFSTYSTEAGISHLIMLDARGVMLHRVPLSGRGSMSVPTLAEVDGVFNAIRLTGDFVDTVMFYGRGAGMEPTASAIVGDVMGIARNLIAGIGKRIAPLGYLDGSLKKLEIKPMGEIVSKYYIRFSALDKPGVLSRISGILGKYDISIESMIQTARMAGETVPIVIMTHEALEKDVCRALEEIDSLDIVSEKSRLIRIEDALQ